nr:hypothetical protein [Saprospiraceae bacterium]
MLRLVYLLLSLGLLFLCACESLSSDKDKTKTLAAEEQQSILPAELRAQTLTWESHHEHDQTAYQVLVASRSDLLTEQDADLYNSGIKASNQQSHTSFVSGGKGKAYWTVRTWHGADTATAWATAQEVKVAPADDASRIVFIGGTSIAQMDDYPYLEMRLSQHWKAMNVTFRNVGWPADDVFGLARSQFGSAQNTRSWQPPTAEEGFGSEVLKDHLALADPSLLLIGYGGETAWQKTEEEYDIFWRGYRDLVEHAQGQGYEVILLTPTRHYPGTSTGPDEIRQRNQNLKKASRDILKLAEEQDLASVDLFAAFDDPSMCWENGYQLNAYGHQRMADEIAHAMGLATEESAKLIFDEGAFPSTTGSVQLSNWKRTITGVRFDLKNPTAHPLDFSTVNPLRIDNVTFEAEEARAHLFQDDSVRIAQLRSAITQKNKYHRYRIRPLNEAYIFLFRRHEMGHLAHELDQFDELIAEEEGRIKRLLDPAPKRIEITLDRDWKAPREYPEDEVPANVPTPDIEDELASFSLASGLTMNAYASDPMIANPIGMNWDLEGRAWVATSSTYPHILPGREPNDRIVILEDTNDDGVADTSIVFADGLLVPQSVMPVQGGAYVCSTTEFLFLADTNGDDRADLRQTIYDGFGNADVHHMIHGLRWAPWGDLFFTQSIYINSFVETPHGNRILNGSGTWQFRPEEERLEIWSRGLINPWGHAFDQWGQAFATDGAGSSGMNYQYPGSAHATAVGASRVLPGLNSGTPKNTAAEVISSRHFPPSWQGSIITNDFRRNRTVRYALTKQGSSYRSEEVQTLARSDHRSYRPVDVKMGPDGAMYIVDWYNPIIDHGEVDFHHPIRDRSHGRIWRATMKGRPLLPKIDFTQQSESALLDLLRSPEQLTRLQANRMLVERGVTKQAIEKWVARIPLRSQADDQHRLEALWLSVASGNPMVDLAKSLLRSANAPIRAAAVRMLPYCQIEEPSLYQNLINDADAQVRLETVNALRGIHSLPAIQLATKVMQDSLDRDLDYLLWLTLKDSKTAWLPRLKEDPSLFGDHPDRVLYALEAAQDSAAMVLLTDLTKSGYFVDDLKSQALKGLARHGDDLAVQFVFDEAVASTDMELLESLVTAPSDHHSMPADMSALGSMLTSSESMIRAMAAKLSGRWKAQSHAAEVAALFSTAG